MNIIKKLSKLVGFAVISILFAGSAYATTTTGSHDFAAKQQEMLAKLNLNDSQKVQVEGIVNESHTQRMAIMNEFKDAQGPAKKIEMRDKLKSLHKETQDKLSKVLTPDQMNILEQYEDEMAAEVKAQIKAKQ